MKLSRFRRATPVRPSDASPRGIWVGSRTLEDCTTKLESNSFRILLSAGYNSFQAFDAVDDAVKVNRHQTLPKFSEIVSPLHYCGYATGCREKRSLLTEQAVPLSEGSLSRQQVFVLAPAVSTLCCCIKWILQVTAVLLPRTLTNRRHQFLCSLRIAQLPSLQPCFACTVQSCSSISHEHYSFWRRSCGASRFTKFVDSQLTF